MTEKERQERQERLAEIDQIAAMDRVELVSDLRHAEYFYCQIAGELKSKLAALPSAFSILESFKTGEYAKTLDRVDPRNDWDHFKYLCEKAQELELAAQRLDMHDNPNKWREWIEDAFSEPSYFPADYENFTSWG